MNWNELLLWVIDYYTLLSIISSIIVFHFFTGNPGAIHRTREDYRWLLYISTNNPRELLLNSKNFFQIDLFHYFLFQTIPMFVSKNFLGGSHIKLFQTNFNTFFKTTSYFKIAFFQVFSFKSSSLVFFIQINANTFPLK